MRIDIPILSGYLVFFGVAHTGSEWVYYKLNNMKQIFRSGHMMGCLFQFYTVE